MFDPRLEDLKRASGSYWTTRIASQLEYAHQLSRLAAGAHDRLIEGTIAALAEPAMMPAIFTVAIGTGST